MSAAVKVGSRTDVGCVRDHNEDALLVQAPLFAVADGMGGHEAGEVASALAIEALAERAPRRIDPIALTEAIAAANAAILRGARDGTGKDGMGTTLTVAVLEGSRLLIAQVGDSRAYLLHEGKLQQVTRDHSLVEELVSTGKITPAEAAVHPNRSVITRALGGEVATHPDLYELEVANGDRLLLCSDGLSGLIDTMAIRHILNEARDPQKAADALIDAAREAGGYDNISTIVVNVVNVASPHGRKRTRRSFLGILTVILIFVALVGAALGGLYLYAWNSAFLLADDYGYVNVYRGIHGNGAFGIDYEWFEYNTTVKVDDLPAVTAQRLTEGIPVDSLDAASDLVDEYLRQIGEKRTP